MLCVWQTLSSNSSDDYLIKDMIPLSICSLFFKVLQKDGSNNVKVKMLEITDFTISKLC